MKIERKMFDGALLVGMEGYVKRFGWERIATVELLASIASLSAPGGKLEGALISSTGVHRLAVRDDHVLERQLEQRAERG